VGLEDSSHPTPRRQRQRTRDQDRHRPRGLALRETLSQVGQPLQHLGGGLEVEPGAFQSRQKHAGDEARIAIRRHAHEEAGPQVRGLFFQPVAVLVDNVMLATEAPIQRAPRAVRSPVELVQRRIPVQRLRRRIDLGQQFIIAVNRPRRVADRQPGRTAEIGPVSPAIVDAPAMNAGFSLEPKQRDFGSGFGDDAAEGGEEVGGGEHGRDPWSFVLGHWGRGVVCAVHPMGKCCADLSEPGRVGPDGRANNSQTDDRGDTPRLLQGDRGRRSNEALAPRSGDRGLSTGKLPPLCRTRVSPFDYGIETGSAGTSTRGRPSFATQLVRSRNRHD